MEGFLFLVFVGLLLPGGLSYTSPEYKPTKYYKQGDITEADVQRVTDSFPSTFIFYLNRTATQVDDLLTKVYLEFQSIRLNVSGTDILNMNEASAAVLNGSGRLVPLKSDLRALSKVLSAVDPQDVRAMVAVNLAVVTYDTIHKSLDTFMRFVLNQFTQVQYDILTSSRYAGKYSEEVRKDIALSLDLIELQKLPNIQTIISAAISYLDEVLSPFASIHHGPA